jgi:hypothetical protein
MSKPQPFITRVPDRLALSFLSAWVGWGAGMLLFLIIGLCTLTTGSRDRLFFGSGDSFTWTYLIEGLFVIGMVMGFWILIIWFFVLVPLALLVPSRSLLWKPRILTMCGILAGPSIFVAWFGVGSFSFPTDPIELYQSFFWVIAPAIVGGATCYVGARLHQRFLFRAF